MSVIIPYKPLPVRFTRGEGMYLWDQQNNRYLDAMAGIAVTSLGHSHPAIVKAITDQASQLIHTSNVFEIQNQITLGEELTKLTGMEQIFFCNSGAEANEAAIKLSRLYGHQKKLAEPKIIVMQHAFHGRTTGAVSASGGEKVRVGFEPFLPGFIRAPYNDLDAIHDLAKQHPDIAAILVEPIQGEGGVFVPSEHYLPELRKICDQYDWLLMLDEVQTGVGRTGKLYNYQYYDMLPDVLLTAKALGNGFPIGACLVAKRATGLFQVGKHGSTFGGNPLACAVGLAVIQTMLQNNIPAHAQKMGTLLLNSLKQALSNYSIVKEIRGKGLMIGIELDKPAQPLLQKGLETGILLNVTAEKIIRLLPPLIIEPNHIETLTEKLEALIKYF